MSLRLVLAALLAACLAQERAFAQAPVLEGDSLGGALGTCHGGPGEEISCDSTTTTSPSSSTTSTLHSTLPLSDAQVDHIRVAKMRVDLAASQLQTLQAQAQALAYERQNAANGYQAAVMDAARAVGMPENGAGHYQLDLDAKVFRLQ